MSLEKLHQKLGPKMRQSMQKIAKTWQTCAKNGVQTQKNCIAGKNVHWRRYHLFASVTVTLWHLTSLSSGTVQSLRPDWAWPVWRSLTSPPGSSGGGVTGERRLAWDWTGLDLGGPGLDLGWPGLDWTLGSLAWGGLDWTGLAWTLGGWTGLDWPGQKYCDCMPCMTVNTTTSRFVTVCLACDTGSYDLGEGQSLWFKGFEGLSQPFERIFY